ncbi:MAG: helix-turn-helix domain-containing protein [Bacteroidetes bacterium]|nr:MAG: helix-turn-helix domain-containing protein [Bacteroidota bacterium]
MSERDRLVIGRNLKHLRKLKGLTQQQLADELNIRRSSIGAYEECRATPKYETIEGISNFFQVSIDLLVKEDLSGYSEEQLRERQASRGPDIEGKSLRVLSITVDQDGHENIEYVPQKASAGYLNGFADKEYLEDLPKFQLPMLRGGTFRAFQIKGDSMLPLKSGTIIIGQYLEDWRDIKEGQTYIVLSESEGVVYKRVFRHQGRDGEAMLRLKSDNPAYEDYFIELTDVREIWKARMYLSEEFPQPDMSLEKLSSIVMEIQQEVIRLKSGNN